MPGTWVIIEDSFCAEYECCVVLFAEVDEGFGIVR